MKCISLRVAKKEPNNVLSLSLCFLTLLTIFAALKANNAYAIENQDHPLIGKIWSVKESKYVDLDFLKKSILSSDHVVVGETHDNLEHHQIQAQVLQWFIDAKRDINPVFEMLSEEQLNPLQKTKLTNSESFFDKVAWEESGWPDRNLYKPIFDIVINNNLTITAAETERDVLMKLMKKGEDGLPDEIRQSLQTVKLDKQSKEQLKQEIIDSHCGMLPDKMVEPMILGQRVRDVVMANSLLRASEKGQTLLIAGSGHGRKDYGVPAYIRSRNADAKITTLAMIEVVDEVLQPDEYSEAWTSEEIPFDFVWFTSRTNREDPCEELKSHFKKHPA